MRQPITIFYSVGFSILFRLDQKKTKNDTTTPKSIILDLASILGLPVYININRKPNVYPLPPNPYHRDMDSSTHNHSPGMKFSALCSLKVEIMSSTNIHDVEEDLVSGWFLRLRHWKRVSYLCLERPVVLPIEGAGMNLLGADVSHNESLEVN